eukprot:7823030-Pyramimonas_sp.AAC.1
MQLDSYQRGDLLLLCLSESTLRHRERRCVLDLCLHRYRQSPAGQAPESTLSQPMAVCRQGTYVEYSMEYSMEYSKCRALNAILVSTVDDCRLLN